METVNSSSGPTPSEKVILLAELDNYSNKVTPIWPIYLIGAGLSILLVNEVLSRQYLQGWIFFYLLFIITRFIIFGTYNKLTATEKKENLNKWKKIFMAVVAVYGLFQSALIAPAIFYLPDGARIFCTWMIVVSCVIVSITSPLSQAALIIYYSSSIIPIAIAWQFADSNYSVGVLIVIFLSLLMFRKIGMNQLMEIRKSIILTNQLEINCEHLKNINITKSRITMEVTHDLRQPAQALGMMIERLRLQGPEQDFDARMDQISATMNSLSDQLSDLLDFTRIERDNFEPQLQMVDLAKILSEIDTRYSIVAKSRNLAWQVQPCHVNVHSDPWLLVRIFSNIVSNSLKYSNFGGIVIKCDIEGTQAVVSFKDNGIGISEDMHNEIFKEYYRIIGTEINAPGLGLGLAVVKRATTVLGHKLSIDSSPGKGTEFKISMPIVAAPDQSMPDYSPQEAVLDTDILTGKTCFLIENDEIIRLSLKEVLLAWGIQVFDFKNGDNFYLTEKENLPVGLDFIISDMHLEAQLNGMQAINTVREKYANSNILAFLTTGEILSEIELLANGSNAFVTYKPIRPSLLKVMLAEKLALMP